MVQKTPRIIRVNSEIVSRESKCRPELEETEGVPCVLYSRALEVIRLPWECYHGKYQSGVLPLFRDTAFPSENLVTEKRETLADDGTNLEKSESPR